MGRFPLLPRKKNSDKSHYGHVLVIAGSRAMPGAAILTSRAALRSGSGLVTLATPISVETALVKLDPEIMRLWVTATGEGTLVSAAWKKICAFVSKRKINAVAIGPGLTQSLQTSLLTRKVVQKLPIAMVVDADGLNAFKGRLAALAKHGGPRVLTPHKREFERLFGVKWPQSDGHRRILAKRLSKFYDVVLVLKGHRTLVVYKDKVYVNRTGNSGMAKGGTGDVLTGMIAAFIAQGLSPFEAAKWGVYFHGRAGDEALRGKSELSLTASDLIEVLPKVLK